MPVPQGDKAKKKNEAARAKTKEQQRRNTEAQKARAAEREVEAHKTSKELSRPLVGPRKDGDETYMSRVDMLELLYAQERLQHAETKKEKAMADIKQNDAAYAYKRDKAAATHHMAELERIQCKGDLQALHQDIEQVYGVSIKDVVFDTETGLISRPPK